MQRGPPGGPPARCRRRSLPRPTSTRRRRLPAPGRASVAVAPGSAARRARPPRTGGWWRLARALRLLNAARRCQRTSTSSRMTAMTSAATAMVRVFMSHPSPAGAPVNQREGQISGSSHRCEGPWLSLGVHLAVDNASRTAGSVPPCSSEQQPPRSRVSPASTSSPGGVRCWWRNPTLQSRGRWSSVSPAEAVPGGRYVGATCTGDRGPPS